MSALDIAVKTRLTEEQASILYNFVGDWGEVMNFALISLHGIDFPVLIASAKAGVGAKELAAILDALRNQS